MGEILASFFISDNGHYQKDIPFELPKGWCWTTLGSLSNYGKCTNVDAVNIPKTSWILELEDIEKDVVYPHSFRHRFAKNFLERFNDIALLADLMGHERLETTRIYLRRTASEQQKIVDKVVVW